MGIIDPSFDRPDPALAGQLVEARFGMSTDLVKEYDAESSGALDELAGITFSIPLENIDLGFDDVAPPNIGDAPQPTKVDPYEDPTSPVVFPDLNYLSGLLDLATITLAETQLPTLEAQPPIVSVPDAPDDPIPDVPNDVPEVTDKDMPPVPDITLPPDPVLEDIELPVVPEVQTLNFDGVLPTVELIPPEPMFIYDEREYQSDLADAIRTKLYNDVTVGGTGLGAAIEQDIWDRTLTRLNTELDKAYNQVLTNFEGWNSDMPDGMLAGALSETIYENNRARLDANRDISIEQARLAQENTQFAITNGLVYEKQQMDFINQINNRAFEVAKAEVQATIDVFSIRVTAYNAQLEGYKAAAAAFESLVRAELTKVEIYKTQMEGAKIHGDLQEQKVAIYSQRVRALQTLIDLYNAQLEAVRTQVVVDEAKIKAFNAKLDAVVAQINGVMSKYNLYQAQIAGESAKVDLYGKQVDAYSAEVQAARVVADINNDQLQAAVESNKDKYQLLQNATDIYRADTQYELGKADTSARVYSSEVDGYEAEVRRETDYLKSKIDRYRAEVTAIATEAELAIKEVDVNLRAELAAKELQVEALKATANIQTQKVASALTGVSASAQIGFNAGLSDSYSISNSNNDNNIISYDTGYRWQYNYNF
jgi:hypothetical protein